MSRKRIPSSQRRTRRKLRAKATAKNSKSASAAASAWLNPNLPDAWNARTHTHGLKVHHFLGVSLAGGKTDKTCLAMVEYYPAHNKIFLSRLFEKIRSENEVSADLQLHRLIEQCPGKVETLAFDVPLDVPKCMRCRLTCPGYEACSEPEILWMWNHYRKLNDKRKPKRLFTPYTERCVEMYLANELEESFHLPHALGANVAPLTARAHFVARRLRLPLIEVYPRLSLWRIGRALSIARSHLLFHKHAIGGDESRRVILHRLVDRDIAFLYEQDVRAMVENNHAFEAFLSALTGVLQFKGLCEARPKDFPKQESWIAIPKPDIEW